MLNDHNPIDELFRQGLKDGGITPPQGVWEAVSGALPSASAPGGVALLIKSVWTWVVVGSVSIAALSAVLLSEPKDEVIRVNDSTVNKTDRPAVTEDNAAATDYVSSQQADAISEDALKGVSENSRQTNKDAESYMEENAKPNVATSAELSVVETKVEQTHDSHTGRIQEEQSSGTETRNVESVSSIPCGRNLKINAVCAESDNTWTFSVGNVPAGSYFSWNYGDGESGSGNPATHIYPDINASYTARVVVFRSAGCMDSGTCPVVTRQRRQTLSIPDVFTPNGDGINDELVIVLPEVTQFHQVVTDLRGKQVYVSDNPSVRWNGKCASVDCPPGRYRVTISYKLSSATKATTFTKTIILNR